ncbi:MAG TPA: cytochrome C oxidase subunit IV family protein [Polyangiaceae bacterium]|nr:cytochrome C oxidase subunit IV family protein [Polyangiaceae bacterium]
MTDSNHTSNAHAESGRAYVFAWLALLVLTLVSFGAHYLELGAFATAVSLIIAAVKAGVVALVFMHLKTESVSVRTVAALNLAWVALICVGIALDVAAH